MGRGTGHSARSRSLKPLRPLPADHVFQSLGSTGSLSSASTPKNTLVCSPQLFAADESPEGFDPQCKSRLAGERLAPTLLARNRSRLPGNRYSGP